MIFKRNMVPLVIILLAIFGFWFSMYVVNFSKWLDDLITN